MKDDGSNFGSEDLSFDGVEKFMDEGIHCGDNRLNNLALGDAHNLGEITRDKEDSSKSKRL